MESLKELQALIGTRVRASAAVDLPSHRAPRDRVIQQVWRNAKGEHFAWSEAGQSHHRGEHLIASSQAALIAQIMALA